MTDIMQLLFNVFGPAAVTLILMIIAIQKMWPQLIMNQDQTRETNRELVDALRKVSEQSSDMADRWLDVFNRTHNDNLRELERLSEDHKRFERQIAQRHNEQMQSLEAINRSLQGVAKSLNGG